jgi:hypothetical protein
MVQGASVLNQTKEFSGENRLDKQETVNESKYGTKKK